MLRLPSLIKPYVDFWSEDESFIQPPAKPSADVDDETRKAYDEALADYTAKLTAVIDTGNWSALRKEGAGEPTGFVMRQLSADVLGKILDLRQSDKIGEREVMSLVFRAALISLTHFDGPKIVHDEDEDLGNLVSLKWMESVGFVGAVGIRIIQEIGARVFVRASQLGPK